MPKSSALTKIVALLLLVMMIPVAALAFTPGDIMCDPTACPEVCPTGSYDCTWDWITESWENFMLFYMVTSAGYNFTVCCEA